MSRKRRAALHEPGAEGFLRKSAYLAFSQGSVGLLFILYVFAARILGDAGFGQFTLGMAVSAILFILPAWGSGRYSSIIAARTPERTEEIFADYLGLTLPLVLLYFPLTGVTAFALTEDPTVVAVSLLLGVDHLMREIGNVLRLLFRVHDEYPLEALTSFAERGGIIVAAAVVLWLDPDPVALAGAFAAGRGAGTLVTTGAFRRRIGRISVRLDGSALRHLFTAGTPLALRRGIGMLTFRVDMLFLGALRPPREVGWYGSIYTVMDGAVMVPNAVTGSFGPTISANYAEGELDTVGRLYRRGLKYLVLVGLFLGVALAILAESFVGLVFGSQYLPAAPALTILALAMPLVFVRTLTTEVLDNVDLRGDSVRMFALALALNVVLNIILVPAYGFIGAASSTLATEACLAVSMVVVLGRAGYRAELLAQTRGPALAILPAGALMFGLGSTPLLAGVVGGAVYLLGLTLFGTWDDKDRHLLRSVAARFGGGATGDP